MQATPRAPITVSIVSHGQQHLLAPLLQQLQQHCAASIAKVVLTRNLPEPGPRPIAPPDLAVEELNNAVPKGFGANHNAAFARCDTDWFLVLNPDIRLDRDALAQLLSLAQPGVGLLAPRIDEPGRAGLEPHRDLLTPCEILRRDRAAYRPPVAPAWVPGMFMLLRAAAFRQVGGFDRRFFMYGEDFDLCARLRLAGWEIAVAEDLSVRHEAQRASRRRVRHLLWHCASLCKVWTSSAFWRYRRQWRRS